MWWIITTKHGIRAGGGFWIWCGSPRGKESVENTLYLKKILHCELAYEVRWIINYKEEQLLFWETLLVIYISCTSPDKNIVDAIFKSNFRLNISLFYQLWVCKPGPNNFNINEETTNISTHKHHNEIS